MKNRKLNDKQINWLKNNYTKLGIKECAEFLNISRQKTYRIAKKYGLKHNGEVGKYVVDMSLFNNINTPEIAYFLGFFWGDGHLSKGKNSTYLSINIVKKDFVKIKNILLKYINWDVRFRTQGNRQEQASLGFRGNRLGQFLIEYDYLIKSGVSPDKILSKIPEHLKHYWWRGYFDADGHVSDSNKNIIQFASTYEQDWGFAIDLFVILGVTKYRIDRKIHRHNKNRGSVIVLQSLSNINKLFTYIYKGYRTNEIGLPRKYYRFLTLHKKYNNFVNNKTSQYTGVDFNKQTQKWRSFVSINKKQICLGYFNTELLAYNARLYAKSQSST